MPGNAARPLFAARNKTTISSQLGERDAARPPLETSSKCSRDDVAVELWRDVYGAAEIRMRS